jgi:hypothetical protein
MESVSPFTLAMSRVALGLGRFGYPVLAMAYDETQDTVALALEQGVHRHVSLVRRSRTTLSSHTTWHACWVNPACVHGASIRGVQCWSRSGHSTTGYSCAI